MIVYFTVAGLYFITSLFWAIWLIRFNSNLQRYQYAMTALLIASFVQEILWGSNYVDYNNSGNPSLGILIPAVLFSAVKLTGIRLLLLFMGLGYAITKPTLEPALILGSAIISVCYFVISAADSYISVSNLFSTAVSSAVTYLTGVLVVIVNIIFILWIVTSTFRSMTVCKKEKNDKYGMYKRLMIIFGVICLISIIFFFVQFGLDLSDVVQASFRVWWLLDTYWDHLLRSYCLHGFRVAPNRRQCAICLRSAWR